MQESKLKDKLEQIETEIDLSLKKTYYSNPNFKTPSDIKDEAREQELRETKSRITVQYTDIQRLTHRALLDIFILQIKDIE